MAPKLSSFSTCSLKSEGACSNIISRPHPAGDGLQTLVLCAGALRPLLGADTRASFALGEPIGIEGFNIPGDIIVEVPVWDSWSGATYMFVDYALVRLVGNHVSLVAGTIGEGGQDDGAGPEARFTVGEFDTQLASDGAGSLFLCEGRRFRRIQLPAAWRAGAGALEAAGAAQEATAAVVSTLPYEAPSAMCGMVFLPPAAFSSSSRTGTGVASSSSSSNSSSSSGAGWLVFKTTTALYRLQLPGSPEAAAAAGGGAQAAFQPQLLAGCEGQPGYIDGHGAEARLAFSCGLVADATGCIYFVDKNSGAGFCFNVRRVSPDGAVTTLVTSLPHHSWWSPAVLPNGYLAAVGGINLDDLMLLDLGLTPVLPAVSHVASELEAAGPPPRSLPADLGALLDAQPDGSADLTVCVGERRFHAHRLILSARCDYFRQRLAGEGFADARSAELELPDADPDAFALLLRWLYTGTVELPSDKACCVAELADRLLLPELCTAAQGVVAASVTVGTVVDSLLWAWGCSESRGGGGGFGKLLGQLKEWYVEHHEEVRREAGPSRQKLAACAPVLMEELMDAAMDFDRRSRKRQRT